MWPVVVAEVKPKGVVVRLCDVSPNIWTVPPSKVCRAAKTCAASTPSSLSAPLTAGGIPGLTGE